MPTSPQDGSQLPGRPSLPPSRGENLALAAIVLLSIAIVLAVLLHPEGCSAAAGPPPGPLEETGGWIGPECVVRLWPVSMPW